MNLRTNGATIALAGILTIGLAACGGSADAETADYAAPESVETEAVLSAETLVVYKTSACECCGRWVDYMETAGFEVEVHELSQEELTALKADKGITPDLASCHTAEIAGYLVEGHVPAEDLRRLLSEKPADVKGIAVPGMPIGSPGMEIEGRPAEEYETVVFNAAGEQKDFAQH